MATGKLARKSSDTSSLMASLLERHKPNIVSRGQEIQGRILSITGSQLILDIGAKSEGLVEAKEYDQVKNFIKTLSVGDIVPVIVVYPESRNGFAIVSLKNFAVGASWKILEQAVSTGEEVEVIGKNVNKAGIIVDFRGIEGFIPNSQLGSSATSNPATLVDKTIPVQVLKIERDEGRVIFSEKVVSDKDAIKEKTELVGRIKLGEEFEGEIVKIIDSGAFVRISKDGIDIEGLARGLGDLGVGDKVLVRVTGKDRDRLFLGSKEDDIASLEKYLPDTKVSGRVLRTTSKSVMVELEPGVSGSILLKSLPPGTSLNAGDRVECFVDSVDTKRQRITLRPVLREKPVGYK